MDPTILLITRIPNVDEGSSAFLEFLYTPDNCVASVERW
jgi:hypothetical protein